MHDQIACFTFFRYAGKNKKWGLSQMYLSRAALNKLKDLKFYKLVGLGGGNGYSLKSNFDSYGLFTVWDHPLYAQDFFLSDLFTEFLDHSIENFTILMKPIASKGSWSGFNGWKLSRMEANNPLVCVLTRATLKVRFIYPFFSMIAKVMKDHSRFPGLLFSRGFSEFPFREQATFSIWENVDHMKKFAYQSIHARAIRLTRKRKGFKEDMYTRFQPVATVGTWNGENPLLNKVSDIQDYHLIESTLVS